MRFFSAVYLSLSMMIDITDREGFLAMTSPKQKPSLLASKIDHTIICCKNASRNNQALLFHLFFTPHNVGSNNSYLPGSCLPSLPQTLCIALQPPSSEAVSCKSPYHFPNSSYLPHESHSPCPCLRGSPLVLISSRDLSNETSDTRDSGPSGKRASQETTEDTSHLRHLLTGEVTVGLPLPPAGCLARPGNCRMLTRFFLLRGVRQRNSL